METSDMTEQQAIEAWNTRAERTFPDEVQEAQHHLCELERITGEAWRTERTCRAEQDYDAMEDGIPDCRIWRCSCGEAFPYWRGCFPEYCPNCGAKVVE